MKIRFCILIIISFQSLVSYEQTPDWSWAKSAGGTKQDWVNSSAVDASENIYIIGNYASPTIDFDTFSLSITDIYYLDMFLAKYDADGNVLWVKSIVGTYNEWGKSGVSLNSWGQS